MLYCSLQLALISPLLQSETQENHLNHCYYLTPDFSAFDSVMVVVPPFVGWEDVIFGLGT
jgi:hypothetical protein